MPLNCFVTWACDSFHFSCEVRVTAAEATYYKPKCRVRIAVPSGPGERGLRVSTRGGFRFHRVGLSRFSRPGIPPRGRSCTRLAGEGAKDLYVQLAEKRSSATTAIEILRPAWDGGLRMTFWAF